ncbi:hypothetical protein [Blastococcus sp. LR1]|uniref:hypothetical protein n=1 Tax=Blastococcus sp. LR1 TaxID=2877000 RepID=UPI001CD03A08|nr:hypothetical protein [Blastococcus sp. LR1]MCA0145381.1 hypothetical protein [Blastococcus sp. LR1]
MSTVSGSAKVPRGPGAGSGLWDPIGMTEAEKLAAEREARHDVVARGRRPAQESLQHYLAHERLTHGGERRTVHRGGGTPAAGAAVTRPAPPPEEPAAPAPRPGGLFARLFRRRR